MVPGRQRRRYPRVHGLVGGTEFERGGQHQGQLFVVEPDGSLLVAAGSPSAHWAANLLADPACHGTIGAVRRAYRAEEIEGPDRARAIAELILKYGTPAEGLGVGPAFRLRPLDD